MTAPPRPRFPVPPGPRTAPESADAARRPGGAATASLRSLSMAMFKGYLRDRTTMFFTFVFPLMFLVVFGLLFGDSGTSRTRIAVVGDGPVIAALDRTGAVEEQRFATLDQALEKVRSGDLPAAVAQQGNDVVLRFAASDQVRAGMVLGLVGGVVDQVNLAATGQPPRLALQAQRVEDTSFKAIQFLTPGILSWGVATSAVFGTAAALVSWRSKQVLRRIRLAPVRPWTVLSSRLLVSIVVSVLQAALFVAVAATPVFGLTLGGQWWLAVPLLVVGTLAFFSVGVLVGSFTKTPEAATAVANLLVLPMAFLSGTFFNIDNAPRWLQLVSKALPLRHMNDGMLDVLVRGKGAGALVTPVAVLLGFTVVVGFLASRLFSWEDS
jgi:ABC-2 type transport system permease protein